MTLIGKSHDIRIFDDFAHHPTAIAGMVSAAKASMQSCGKLWVILEPRSNTMRSTIHQDRLPHCFDAADQVIFTPPSHRNLADDAILDVAAICRTIGETKAQVIDTTDAIIEYVATHAQHGDDVLILSNGGFENIHQRLLNTLKERS